MILETNMLGYIYTFFFILFHQSLHTTSLERSLFFMYYLLDERQLKAFISNKHVFNLQRFERERVYSGNELFNKLCTSLPSIFMTGVHPPSPHPKFPMWQKTDNGWESTRRVTTPLILDLLNKKKKKYNDRWKQWWWNRTWAFKDNYHSYIGGNENDNGKDNKW